jgi:hypothetical protein
MSWPINLSRPVMVFRIGVHVSSFSCFHFFFEQNNGNNLIRTSRSSWNICGVTLHAGRSSIQIQVSTLSSQLPCSCVGVVIHLWLELNSFFFLVIRTPCLAWFDCSCRSTDHTFTCLSLLRGGLLTSVYLGETVWF